MEDKVADGVAQRIQRHGVHVGRRAVGGALAAVAGGEEGEEEGAGGVCRAQRGAQPVQGGLCPGKAIVAQRQRQR